MHTYPLKPEQFDIFYSNVLQIDSESMKHRLFLKYRHYNIMTSESTKSIPEALLKLKAALEEGKRDEVVQPMRNKQSSALEKQKKTKKMPQKSFAPTRNFVQHQAKKTEKNTFPKGEINPEQTNTDVQNNTKKHINSKHIPLSQNERVKAALAWLYETFPNLFNVNNRIPLKIGITHDVAAWIDAHNKKSTEEFSGYTATQREEKTVFIPSKTAIRDAITVYTNALQYQKALLNNNKRYDLDGNEVGVVEEKQKEHADQRNAKIEAAIQAQAEKREALRERRKMIAEAWRAEKDAKKKDAPLAADLAK